MSLNASKTFSSAVLGLSMLMFGVVPVKADHSVLSVTSGTTGGCYDLLAGQTIDAGDVCFSVDASSGTLTVSYYTYDGWELTEAHLWVGETQDGYPKAKNGNPKIGNFPYNSGDITGRTAYSFSLPLGNVQSFFDLDDLDTYCDQSGTIYAMAHAALRKDDGTGGYQTETGWSDGEGAVQRGSWATRSAINLSVTCNEPPKPPTVGQETALMFGSIELNDENDGICDGVYNGERWGWQESFNQAGFYQKDIWAAAGNNVLTNGTMVGYVDIEISDEPAPGNVTVTPVFFDGFTPEETHIYIGTEPVCSGAFGKDWDELASTDIDISGGVYVGLHFSVKAECGINQESPDNFCDKE